MPSPVPYRQRCIICGTDRGPDSEPYQWCDRCSQARLAATVDVGEWL